MYNIYDLSTYYPFLPTAVLGAIDRCILDIKLNIHMPAFTYKTLTQNTAEIFAYANIIIRPGVSSSPDVLAELGVTYRGPNGKLNTILIPVYDMRDLSYSVAQSSYCVADPAGVADLFAGADLVTFDPRVIHPDCIFMDQDAPEVSFIMYELTGANTGTDVHQSTPVELVPSEDIYLIDGNNVSFSGNGAAVNIYSAPSAGKGIFTESPWTVPTTEDLSKHIDIKGLRSINGQTTTARISATGSLDEITTTEAITADAGSSQQIVITINPAE